MESPKNRPHCRLRKRLHMLRVCMAARESNPFCGGEAARSLSMSYVDVKSVGKVQAKMQSIKDMHPKLGMIFCRNNLRYSFPSGTSVTDIVVFHVLSLAALERPGRRKSTSVRYSYRNLLRIYPWVKIAQTGCGLGGWGAGFVFVAPPSDFPTTSHCTIAR